MKASKILLAALVLAMLGLSALELARVKSQERLGEPGIKTRPQPGGKNLEVLLPDHLAGYSSEVATQAETVLQNSSMPKDTSFRVRFYKGDDGFWTEVSVVLMGSDRSSIHKPQICMTGQGWTEDNAASRVELVHMQRPFPYDLPVNKLVFSKQVTDAEGQVQTVRGLYVYWFVDGNHYTASPMKWKAWWMPRDLLLHHVQERWAYISCFSYCAPGQEDALFSRMKKFLAAAVPEFQSVPKSHSAK
jgi:hypothetical protein